MRLGVRSRSTDPPALQTRPPLRRTISATNHPKQRLPRSLRDTATTDRVTDLFLWINSPVLRVTRDADLPLVSAIITTYDRRELLRRAIGSVESQTYANIELVVVDDHSEVSPEPIVNGVDGGSFDNIVFCRHSENKGVSAARNTGLAESTGELVAFLDDDDIWAPEKIEKQVSELEQSDGAGAVYTGAKSVDATGSTITVQRPTRSGKLTKDLLCDHGIWFPTLLVERSVIEKAGEFREDMLMREDVEWIVRLSQYTQFAVVPEPLLITLRGDDHDQKSDDVEAKIRNGHSQLIEQYRKIASEYSLLFRRKFAGYSEYKMGRAALSGKRPELARRYLSSAIIKWPFEPKFYIYFLLSIFGERWYLRARDIKRSLVTKMDDGNRIDR